MNNKRIRKAVLVAMAALTALSLPGCGSAELPDTVYEKKMQEYEDKKDDYVMPETVVTEDPGYSISVFRPSFDTAQPDKEQVKKVQNAINSYLAVNGKQYSIALTDIPSDEYVDTVKSALENNEINLLWTASWESIIGTNDLVASRSVQDITGLLKGTTLYDSMDEILWNTTEYDNKNYFIPIYKDNAEGYDYMFRKDLVDKYEWDVESVKSLSDLEPMLEDAKSDGIKYPYLTQKTAMFYRWYVDRYDFFTADSTSDWVAVDRASNEVVNTVESEQYLEFCKLMAEWSEKGYISIDDQTKATQETITQTQDWAVSWWTDVPVNEEAGKRYGQDIVTVKATERWAHSTSALGSCFAITDNTTERMTKDCIDFLGMLYTDKKLADMYTFGIEGEDYEYDSNGKVIQKSDKYRHSMWESAPVTIVTPLDNDPDDKAELYKEFNDGAMVSEAAGFRFDKKPVEEQYASCQRVFDEYGFVLENGGVAPIDVEATIEAYQVALDEAGYQDVLAEFKKQYDEWK